MELLTIVRIEQEAERIIEKAKERRELTLKKALSERDYTLGNLQPLRPRPIEISAREPNLASIRKAAAEHEQVAVEKILEELRAKA